jgi:sarcosine oxidase
LDQYECIVVGLGAMGSAAVRHLAGRGVRVLGIDRFRPPHALGSTHGDTRITRLAIGEGEHYTPLAMRSHELWRELERETGVSLLTCNGGLVISSPTKTSINHVENFFENTVAAARRFGIAHELLDAGAIRRRFPAFNVGDDEYGYFEPSAGFVRPEACVAAHLAVAAREGAALRLDEQVQGFDASDSGVTVRTDRGVYRAERMILSAGAWIPGFVGSEVARHFRIFRQTLFWFDVPDAGANYLPGKFPIFIWELQHRMQGIYGFPAIDGAAGGLKIGAEHYDATTSADAIERTVTSAESEHMHARFVAPFLPGLGPRCVRSAVCLYTVTPDFGFVIDRHPASDRVLIVSPCSGHGFKHSAAIGEALAQIVVDGKSRLDLSGFRLARFDA